MNGLSDRTNFQLGFAGSHSYMKEVETATAIWRDATTQKVEQATAQQTPAQQTHTPAPWMLGGDGTVDNPATGGTIITKRIETPLGTIEIIDGTNEARGNAALIASAPELLEALDHLLWQHDNNKGVLCGMALQDARAAISKAKGA